MTDPNPPTPPAPEIRQLPAASLRFNPFSLAIYGDPDVESGDLIESVRLRGILVPLVVAAIEGSDPPAWEVISGHRRLTSARRTGLADVPCDVQTFPDETRKHEAILDHNRQRRKTYTQLMREADAMESLVSARSLARRDAQLRQNRDNPADRRHSDDRRGRSDTAIALAIGIGGKDLYRQARAVWKAAIEGDPRAASGVALLDRGEKTIHSAYKDLRRRDRFTTGFRPTPYDVWSFKHDRAFGIPHPGSIPPGIVAHTLHYFTAAGDLVVDPMAGGGTTLDVALAMGRRCLAYDLDPVRDDILPGDIRDGLPDATQDAALIFCDPPYHTMLARTYPPDGVSLHPLSTWTDFLNELARTCFGRLRPGGYLALLLANQTEKDLPAGHGYLDHAFLGHQAILAAGFLPQRRISCPMDGAYLPQHVRDARRDGRMLGQVRDLIVARKPLT